MQLGEVGLTIIPKPEQGWQGAQAHYFPLEKTRYC